jgi:glycosyltransferase involved in cell wall biosynthesis
VASVVIPAHNEGSVLGRCLEALLRDAEPGEFEVVVVCNGCQDDTATVARRHPSVAVVETPVGNKAAALNLGDEHVSAFPRIYLDADVQLTTDSARALATALSSGRLLAASPRPEFDLSHVSRPMRAFYAVSAETDYRREGMSGACVYALSAAGRQRFSDFPDLIADDTYVRSMFEPHERGTVGEAAVRVAPARHVRAFVQRSVRVQAGNRQLAALARQEPLSAVPQDGRRHARLIGRTLAQPRLWSALPVYVVITLAVRFLGWRRVRRGDLHTWDRDLSTRDGVAGAR